MKTEKAYTNNDRVQSFSIENIYIRPSKVGKLISGVSDIAVRRPFSRKFGGVHIRFKYHGVDMVMIEPYGDSSEYYFSYENELEPNIVDLKPLVTVIDEYNPPFIRRVIGDFIKH